MSNLNFLLTAHSRITISLYRYPFLHALTSYALFHLALLYVFHHVRSWVKACFPLFSTGTITQYYAAGFLFHFTYWIRLGVDLCWYGLLISELRRQYRITWLNLHTYLIVKTPYITAPSQCMQTVICEFEAGVRSGLAMNEWGYSALLER